MDSSVDHWRDHLRYMIVEQGRHRYGEDRPMKFKVIRMLLPALLAVGVVPTAAVAQPAPTSSAAKSLSLGNKDNGQSFTVQKGEAIIVHLTGRKDGGTIWSWTAPTAANGTILHRQHLVTLPNGDVDALFRAVADGTTTLGSQSRCRVITPGHVCTRMSILWKVTLKVR
ncbi:hypothetical protein [Streptomyces sp. NPDC002573]|uniref:hypothetical protein n=1 Tax=Streptomyces sp. NPDC002573 TaxID=3364651 RepID=UPI0036AD80BE